jgi:RNA polymerase sigma-70 factor (ECF subfamily)
MAMVAVLAVSETVTRQTNGVIDLAGLYQDYGPRCYALALRILGDRHLAEDAVQNVFETLARRPDGYEPERGSLDAWLLTVTHHKAVDMVRWRHRRTCHDLPDDVLDRLADRAPTPDEAARIREDQGRVVAALSELNVGEREVLILAYFGGYSHAEIARRTGLPLGTVKARTRKGMQRMRDLLAAP